LLLPKLDEAIDKMVTKKKILVILAGGGFTAETLALVDYLGKDYSYFYIVPEYIKNYVSNKIRIPGEIISVPKDVIYLAENKVNLVKLFIKIVIGFYKSFLIMKNIFPDVFISMSNVSGLPFCFWGKALKRKVIFLECVSNVAKGSLTAKLTYWLRLADRFYIEWPELKKEFPRAIYKGRVL